MARIRGSKAEELAAQGVLVKSLPVEDLPAPLVLAEMGSLPLVELGDVMVSRGERLLLADRPDPRFDCRLVVGLQLIQSC